MTVEDDEMNDTQMNDTLLTAEEVSALLRVPVASVYELARSQRLPGVVRIGRLVRFQKAALRRFIESGGAPLPGGWRREVR